MLSVLLAAAVAVPLTSAPAAQASKACRSVNATGFYGKVRAKVNVTRGKVSCRTARKAAKDVLADKGCFVDNGFTYNSYFKVPGGWRGQVRMNYLSLRRSRDGAEIAGEIIVLKDPVTRLREC